MRARIVIAVLLPAFLLIGAVLVPCPPSARGQAPDVGEGVGLDLYYCPTCKSNYPGSHYHFQRGGSGESTGGSGGIVGAIIRSIEEEKERKEQARRDEAVRLNDQGIEHYRNGEWQSAIKAFSAASLKWPDNETIQKNLDNATSALAAEIERKSQEQFDRLAGTLRLSPNALTGPKKTQLKLSGTASSSDGLRLTRSDSSAPTEAQALQSWKSTDLNAAEQAYRKLIDAGSGNAQYVASLRMLLAQVLHEKGDNAAAIKELQEAVRLAPDHPRVQLMYAQELAEGGDYRAAEEVLKKYLASDPGNEAAARVLADVQKKQKPGGAVADTTRDALRDMPDDPKSLITYARTLADGGDYRGAEAALRKSLALNPNNQAAAKLVAEMQEKQRQAGVTAQGKAPVSALNQTEEAMKTKAADDFGQFRHDQLQIDGKAPTQWLRVMKDPEVQEAQTELNRLQAELKTLDDDGRKLVEKSQNTTNEEEKKALLDEAKSKLEAYNTKKEISEKKAEKLEALIQRKIDTEVADTQPQLSDDK